MSRGRSGPRQPGGGRQQAGPRGHGRRGQGRDRDERNAAVERNFKERSNPRQSDLRVKHSSKRDGGKGRAISARPPRERIVEARPAPPVAAPKPAYQSAGVQTVSVTADENGMRVDRFFEARFPGLSFSHIQRIIRKGEVRVNGKRTEPKSRLEAGQAVRIPPLQLDAPKPRDDAPQTQKDRAFSNRSRCPKTTTCWCSTSRWALPCRAAPAPRVTSTACWKPCAGTASTRSGRAWCTGSTRTRPAAS